MLPAGRKLGPYEVASAIGAGGMGEVYRARDTRLGRDVALKVLPEAFAADAERLARFRREAQVLASLNHPNIAAIYGFEDSGATHALVMELVEGPTLAERISGVRDGNAKSATESGERKSGTAQSKRSGAIPVDEALPFAKQIAEALEYAHERGIVHRDLKPANIKLAANDAVKILDFGLAKALEGDAASLDISTSPTISRMATQAGIILGTAAYMSPEQAKGKSVDRRTDIWAFGCVLYEMLTGKMAFSGETVTDTLAAVIRAEPDWTLVPAETPMRIRELLQRCLKKDARQRLQSIGDARITLEEILSGAAGQFDSTPYESAAGSIKPPLQAPRWRTGLPWVVAAVCGLVAAGVGAWAWLSPRETSAPPAMAYISPPPGMSFRSFGFGAGPAVVSPDGKEIAFSATDEKGATQIWLRALAGGDSRALGGTEDGAMPFWSPDGHSLGFFADEKLKTVNEQNGTVQVLADASCYNYGTSNGATWGANGVILFTPQCGAPMERISAGGGTPQALTLEGMSPAFLPGGDKFLYVSGGPKQSPTIRMASLSTGKSQLVLNNATSPQFASGYLLFLREGKVFAQRFNAASGIVTGEASPLAEALTFSASNNGVLVSQGGTANARLEWFDRSGNVVGTVSDMAPWIAPKISPDGKQVLAEKGDAAKWDLWSYPATGGIGTRLTFSQGGTGFLGFSVWSPDGKSIAYGCDLGGSAAICRKPSDGSGTEETLLKFGHNVTSIAVVDWSPDGRVLSFDEEDTPHHFSNWVLPLDGSDKPFRPVPVEASQYDGVFSPDGHWMAYFSYETGRPEVFVVPFPPSGAKYQISQTGGWLVRWAVGHRLFYATMGNRLMEADLVTSGKSLHVNAIHPLFKLSLPTVNDPMYDVTPDGNRFIVATSADPAASSSITLVTNWPALVKK